MICLVIDMEDKKMEHKKIAYIYSTKDYNWFSYDVINRNVQDEKAKKHIRELVEELKKDGQLEPIIVTKDGIVINGQHRLEACKILDIPIHYIIRNVSNQMIYKAHSTVKKWSMRTYVESHAKDGKKDYQDLLELADEYKVDVNFIAEISSGRNNEMIRNGEFKLRKKEKVKTFLEFHRGLRSHVIKSGSQGFINALFSLFSIPTIDLERLKEKIIINASEFTVVLNKNQCLEKFLQFYNSSLPKNSHKRIDYVYNSSKKIILKEDEN